MGIKTGCQWEGFGGLSPLGSTESAVSSQCGTFFEQGAQDLSSQFMPAAQLPSV